MDNVVHINDVDAVEFAKYLDARLVEISRQRDIPISELRQEYAQALAVLNMEDIEKRFSVKEWLSRLLSWSGRSLRCAYFDAKMWFKIKITGCL